MRTSKQGIDLITNFEGFVDHVYNDPDGNCTVAYGHLIAYRRCNADDRRKWGEVSRRRGRELLAIDLGPRENAVNRLVKVPITRAQFSALVSLVYNIGEGNFGSSTVLRQLNKKHYRRAAAAFLLWNRGSSGVLPGLVRRRKAEVRLFKSEGWHP